jgi:hypothetical protein
VDQVERAAAEPGDHERSLDGQRSVHIRGGELPAPRPQRKSRRPQVLRLNRQQPPRDPRGRRLAWAAEQLRRRPTRP